MGLALLYITFVLYYKELYTTVHPAGRGEATAALGRSSLGLDAICMAEGVAGIYPFDGMPPGGHNWAL